MAYEFFLARRYLYSRSRRPMARVTGIVAIAGIAVGVAALIVALALANGFRDEMRDKILRGTAHVTLLPKDGEVIRDWPEVAARVRQAEGVHFVTATTYNGVLLSSESGSVYAVVRGVDKNSERAVGDVRSALIEGSIEPLLNDALPVNESRPNATTSDNPGKDENRPASSSPESTTGPDLESFSEAPSEAALPHAIIGSELADRSRLRVGQVVHIISGESQLTPLGPAPIYRRLRIAGIFRTGLYEYDATWIYVSLPIASSLASAPPESASVIAIEVADIYGVNQASARIREIAGEAYTTVDWQDANRPLFAALALERRMGLVVIGLIIFIATLNITTMLVLVVVERRSDIAILIAMGARARSVMLIFVIEGACIGLIGALSGVLLGLVACVVGDKYKLVSLPSEVYSLSNVPFHTRPQDVIIAAIVAAFLSLVATIYPARAAARVRPAEALRDS